MNCDVVLSLHQKAPGQGAFFFDYGGMWVVDAARSSRHGGRGWLFRAMFCARWRIKECGMLSDKESKENAKIRFVGCTGVALGVQ